MMTVSCAFVSYRCAPRSNYCRRPFTLAGRQQSLLSSVPSHFHSLYFSPSFSRISPVRPFLRLFLSFLASRIASIPPSLRRWWWEPLVSSLLIGKCVSVCLCVCVCRLEMSGRCKDLSGCGSSGSIPVSRRRRRRRW